MTSRIVDFKEAHRYSAWPARINGTAAWAKRVQSADENYREYEEDIYGPQLRIWEEDDALPGGSPARFYFSQLVDLADKNNKRQNIHGSTSSEWLCSMGNQLVVMDFIEANLFYRQVVVRRLSEYVRGRNIVEIGCGTGINLFNLASTIPCGELVGCDLSGSAVAIGNGLAAKYGVSARFFECNAFELSEFDALLQMESEYVIVTCHTVERVGTTLVEGILGLTRKPRLVIHCEPLDLGWDDDMTAWQRRYCELNGYCIDLLAVVRAFEELGRLRVQALVPRMFGLSAFHPTSLVAWSPT